MIFGIRMLKPWNPDFVPPETMIFGIRMFGTWTLELLGYKNVFLENNNSIEFGIKRGNFGYHPLLLLFLTLFDRILIPQPSISLFWPILGTLPILIEPCCPETCHYTKAGDFEIDQSICYLGIFMDLLTFYSKITVPLPETIFCQTCLSGTRPLFSTFYAKKHPIYGEEPIFGGTSGKKTTNKNSKPSLLATLTWGGKPKIKIQTLHISFGWSKTKLPLKNAKNM